jgi:tetratricopeptide (TPR) repeat protein
MTAPRFVGRSGKEVHVSKQSGEIPRWVLFGAALAALAASGVLQVLWIDKQPEAIEMFAANPFSTMPHPDVMANYILTNLLGGFKAIAVNTLWMQFLEQKDRQEFVEILPTLELISKLQPTVEEVWIHLAWEESYNLANLAHTLEEKLQWVRAGLKHIKEGCRHNPRSWRLAWQVAYLYWHRVPQDLFVMEEIEKEEGKDPYLTALEWFFKAEELAGNRDRERLARLGHIDVPDVDKFANNTTGFMMVTYAQHLSRLVWKGKFDEAIEKLEDAIRLCDRLKDQVVKTGFTTVHEDRRSSFIDSRPLFRLEKRLAAAIAADSPEKERLWQQTVDLYQGLTRKYYNIDLDYFALRLKYLLVLGLSDVYQLIREDRAAALEVVKTLENKARYVLPKEHKDYFFWETSADEIAEFGKVVVPAEADLIRFEAARNVAAAKERAGELLTVYDRILEKGTWQTPAIISRRQQIVERYVRH